MFTRAGLQDLYAPVARRLNHQLKMDRKKEARKASGDRRTGAYERAKFLAPLTVRRERKRLKSPYAFRRGGL